MPIKHFDLFSGYGGFTLALERAYANNNSGEVETRETQLYGHPSSSRVNELFGLNNLQTSETIGFSEIDKYASAVLKYHWPHIKNYGDITKINWSEVPDFDLITGGSPCQDLSIAGARAGLAGGRSGLFFEYMRAVKEKRPKYFIWENVKGALSSNRGFDFGTVLNEMAEAGYSLWWQVLNAKDFGVPQNRERIFVVGFRDGSPREVFFEGCSNAKCIQQLGNIYKSNGENGNIYGTDGISRTLKSGVTDNPNNGGIGSSNSPKILDDYMVRRLTPVECERLMGLPDKWTSQGFFNNHNDKQVCKNDNCVCGATAISDTQRYKLCGNGVVVNVVEEIIKELILKDYAN